VRARRKSIHSSLRQVVDLRVRRCAPTSRGTWQVWAPLSPLSRP